MKTFEEAKKETYSLFDGRCRELLDDFLREKNEAVCANCSESCAEGQKIQRALRHLIERLTFEAAKRCDDKFDIFVCLLCPYLSTAEMFEIFARDKTAKLLAKEIAGGKDRLLAILKGKKKIAIEFPLSSQQIQNKKGGVSERKT